MGEQGSRTLSGVLSSYMRCLPARCKRGPIPIMGMTNMNRTLLGAAAALMMTVP